MTFTKVGNAGILAADKIREDAARTFDQIRNRGELNADAIAILLARSYLTLKGKMDLLAQTTGQDNSATVRRLTQTAFGIDDLAGNAVDRAAASVSYRDAQDRVAKLEQPNEAAALLERAENSNDELLARAIAQRAFEQRSFDPSWSDLLDEYLATRPKAQAAVGALLAGSAAPQIRDLFAWVLPVPSELAGLGDVQIAALAARPGMT